MSAFFDRQRPSWTFDQVETLRLLWANGKTASEIVEALGFQFSRNAVIGKVHRLGLPKRCNPVGPRRGPRVRPRMPYRADHVATREAWDEAQAFDDSEVFGLSDLAFDDRALFGFAAPGGAE